ncbi:MAG: hypothetical protein J6S14_12320 [Clostridia bacterium]|nr:hypothetical protein [Clostridia bacterium]
MEKNNIAESLRKYAELPEMSVMLQCVLSEAAATIDSLVAERDNLRDEVHILHRELESREDKV